MALSGSFTGSILSGSYKLKVEWSATQNIAANTSKVTAVMYLVQASSWGLDIASRTDNTTTINGTAYTWTSPAINNSGGKTTKLATVTSGNIAHNADGSKSITISSTFNLRATISGTYRGTITASATINLTDIPRATQPTLSTTSANMGAVVTISTPRAASSLTHTLTYELIKGDITGSGGVELLTSGNIASGVGTSYAWTVPDLASYLPNDTQATALITCTTKSGTKTVGTKTVRLTVKVPASIVPPQPTLAISEATEGLAAQFGAYIQNKTTLAVSVAATGIKGSTIKAYQTTLEGKTYTGSSFTSGVLTGKGSIKLVTKVKDSRGRWSAARETIITVLAYSTPQIQTLVARRADSAGAADEEGTYLALTYKYSVTALNNKNTAAVTIDYKKSTATSWTTLTTLTALSGNTVYKPSSPTFDIDYQYDVRLTVKDWFGTSRSYTTQLPSGVVILDIKADGTGMAFFKTADQAGLDLGPKIAGHTSSMGSQTGRWQFPGGPLIQWGIVTITPTTVGSPADTTVTFGKAYTALPTVFLTPVTSVPQNVSVGITGRATTGITVELTRSDNLTSTVINWLAIGPA